MEEILNQPVDTTRRKKGLSWFLFGLSIFLFLLILCYSTLSVISSKRNIEVYNTKLNQVEFSEQESSINSDQPAVYELVNKKVFLSSQLALMNSDSLNLIVDLKDSVVVLVIEGVVMHVTKLSGCSKSHFYENLSNSAYVQIFSKPFNVESYKSTIVKEPITIKQAPKDTTEAASFFEMPDTLISEFVAVSMKLNHNFILTIQQEEKLTSASWTKDRFFLLKLRILQIINDLRQIARMQLPESEPEIRITMPKDDLVTIFRALPQSTLISIRLR
jgi:hypothetical protein